MGFKNTQEYVDAYNNGQTQFSSFRKVMSTALPVSSWLDLSSFAGSPVTNFFANAPLEAATLLAKNGIYHGENVPPGKTKFLKNFVVMNPGVNSPCPQILADYLLYYPFIDMDSTDEQLFTNAVPLPRYSDGKGVRAFLVAQGNYIGGQSFIINYTNEKGVSGRISRVNTTNVATFQGCILSAGTETVLTSAPFITLEGNDQGIRSVESITFIASNGGIAALVLAKPLAVNYIRESISPAEKDFLTEGAVLPEIKNGAFLGIISRALGNVQSSPWHGHIETIWG